MFRVTGISIYFKSKDETKLGNPIIDLCDVFELLPGDMKCKICSGEKCIPVVEHKASRRGLTKIIWLSVRYVVLVNCQWSV
jgi:hypothetical protein